MDYVALPTAMPERMEAWICVHAATVVVALVACSWLLEGFSIQVLACFRGKTGEACIGGIRAADLTFRLHRDTGPPTQPGSGTARS